MAKYTRQDLFGDEKTPEKSHKSHETISTQSREKIAKSLIKVSYRSMTETRELIVFLMEKQERPLTRLEIAKLLKRRKTPIVNRMIEELVSDGVLLRYEDTRPNYTTVFYYEFNRRLANQ